MTTAAAAGSLLARQASSASDVVVADAFDLALFDELLVAVPRLAGMVEELNERFDFTGDLVRDLVLALWQASPRLRTTAEMEPRHRVNQLVITTLVALPETTALRRITVHDAFAAAVSALTMQPCLETLLAVAEAEPAVQEPVIRSLLRVGLAGADMTLTAEGDILNALGVDTATLRRLPYGERAALADRFSSAKIRAFLDLLGQVRASFLPTQRSLHGREEVWDVELSDRLADVLPAEYARLSHRSLRLDFYRQLAEGTLLTQVYRGPSLAGGGPLVICLDTSASMARVDHGGSSREMWAKAFAMALLTEARRARRPVVVILFADRGNQLVFDFTTTAPPSRLVTMVETVLGGGTDFASALSTAFEQVRWLRATNAQAADIVFASDGECALSGDELRSILDTRDSLGARVHGVTVGASDKPLVLAFTSALHSVLMFQEGASGEGSTRVRAGQTPVERFNTHAVSDSLFTIPSAEAM